MSENKEQEPQLVDSENIMMLTTIDKANELLKSQDGYIVTVTRWMPASDKEIGIVFGVNTKPKGVFSTVAREVRPIINGIVAKWGYSENKIKNALKIFSLMGWEHPEFQCSSEEAYPLIIRSGKRYSDKSKESVILIAPRCQT